MRAIAEYERDLCSRLINGLVNVGGIRIFGLTAESDLHERVPTVSFTMDGRTLLELAETLARQNIFTWEGHYYALEVVRRLGLESTGGMLRVGLVHYHTAEEVDTRVGIVERLSVEAGTRAAASA